MTRILTPPKDYVQWLTFTFLAALVVSCAKKSPVAPSPGSLVGTWENAFADTFPSYGDALLFRYT